MIELISNGNDTHMRRLSVCDRLLIELPSLSNQSMEIGGSPEAVHCNWTRSSMRDSTVLYLDPNLAGSVVRGKVSVHGEGQW